MLEALALIMPLLRRADMAVYNHLSRAGVPPYFAIAWQLTWHVHGLASLAHASRQGRTFIPPPPFSST